MRFLLFVLLFLSFAYALGLVLVNNTDVGVNLLFLQAPAMNLGLLLILCLILGIVIGMLLALLMFRVFQNKWEISRLLKLNKNLQEQVVQANVVIDRQANSPTVEDAVYGGATAAYIEDDSSRLDDHSSNRLNNAYPSESSVLTKRKRD